MARLALAMLALVSINTIPAVAHSQSCICDGKLIRRFHGGDADPLTWTYAAYLVSEGAGSHPADVCYLREVQNRSNADVRNIYWKVAGFARRLLRPGVKSSCVELEGDAKSTITSGKLFHGVSDQHYDTTVLEPKAGWETQEASAEEDYRTLKSQLTFDIQGDGYYAPTRLTLWSSVRIDPDKKIALLTYEIDNESKSAISILVNAVATAQMQKDVPWFTSPCVIPPSRSKSIYDLC